MNSIYLISSTSYRLLEEELSKIIKENPYDTFNLNDTPIEDILEEASYVSLFDEKRYIVVKNASIFQASTKKVKDESSPSKKDDQLLKYLESPNSNTILIFIVNGKIDNKKKICKKIKENYNLIEIGDLKPKDIVSKLSDNLKKEDYKCTQDILYYIVNNSLNNYDLSISEIEKIKLYYQKGTTIKLEDVKNIISQNIEDNNFKFIDAVINKKIKEAFKLYDDLMLNKVEPIMLMNMLAKEVRNTLLVKKLSSKKTLPSIMEILGISYDFQINKLINNSYIYTEKKLESLLLSICNLDYKIKTGKISNKLALETLILEFNK